MGDGAGSQAENDAVHARLWGNTGGGAQSKRSPTTAAAAISATTAPVAKGREQAATAASRWTTARPTVQSGHYVAVTQNRGSPIAPFCNFLSCDY